MEKLKSLSLKNKLLIFILALGIIGALYYFLGYEPLMQSKSNVEAQIKDTESNIEATKLKTIKFEVQQEEIEIGKSIGSMVYDYSPDMQANELSFLKSCMDYATTYDFSFEDPITEDGVYVRRVSKASFSTANYATARAIIDALVKSPYRTIFSDVSITQTNRTTTNASNTGFSTNGEVKVTCNITFIESCKNVTGEQRLGLVDKTKKEEADTDTSAAN